MPRTPGLKEPEASQFGPHIGLARLIDSCRHLLDAAGFNTECYHDYNNHILKVFECTGRYLIQGRLGFVRAVDPDEVDVIWMRKEATP